MRPGMMNIFENMRDSMKIFSENGGLNNERWPEM